MVRFGAAAVDVGSGALDTEPFGADYTDLLAAYVTDTFERCSFQRRRMERSGFRPGDLTSGSDLSAIPLMSPDVATAEIGLLPDSYRDAMATGLHTLPPDERMAKKFTTSGSTGAPKVSFYTRSDWEATLAATARCLAHVPPADRSHVFHCFNNGHTAGKVYEDAFSRLGCTVENRHFSLSTEADVLAQMVRGMREVGGFDTLSVPPYTPAGAVQKGITLDGLLRLDTGNYIGAHIRTIITAANWLDDPRYALRQRVWDANDIAGAPRTVFVDTYGCSEVGTLAFECAQMDGLHLLYGAAHTEVTDEAGVQVGNGERGRVVVTGLRHGSRYLRYVVGDEATYVDDACACGYPTPRLRHVERVHDTARLRQGCAAG